MFCIERRPNIRNVFKEKNKTNVKIYEDQRLALKQLPAEMYSRKKKHMSRKMGTSGLHINAVKQ